MASSVMNYLHRGYHSEFLYFPFNDWPPSRILLILSHALFISLSQTKVPRQSFASPNRNLNGNFYCVIGSWYSSLRGQDALGRGSVQYATLFYIGYHLSELQSCTLIFWTNFILFSYLNITRHNLFIELCLVLKYFVFKTVI